VSLTLTPASLGMYTGGREPPHGTPARPTVTEFDAALNSQPSSQAHYSPNSTDRPVPLPRPTNPSAITAILNTGPHLSGRGCDGHGEVARAGEAHEGSGWGAQEKEILGSLFRERRLSVVA
jgi:hypothetical protein